MSVKERIAAKLREGLDPSHIEVIDESAQHAGHASAPEGGESHFRIRVVSRHFDGVSRIERQRLVHCILQEELEGPVHALSIEALSPQE